MTTLCENVHYENGTPTFNAQKVYKCFTEQGNGLLFRLVNEEKKQWAFYNDTKEYIMKVKVEFKKASVVKALGHTTLVKNRAADDGSVIAEIDVQPQKTELFITGDWSGGFDISYSAEALPVMPHYENGRPSVLRGKVYKCFKNEGNGLLFRIVVEDKKQWAFYNDTKSFIMTATAKMNKASKVTPLGNTQSTEDGDTLVYTVKVEPLKTEMFLQGDPEDYQLSFSADPVEKPLSPDNVEFVNSQPTFDGDQIHKCFKNHGNGLLFLLMSGAKKLWAFYNDTKEFNMTAKITFGSGSTIHPLGKTKMTELEDGEIVCELVVPPLKTELFVEGDVTTYQSSYSADPVSTTAPDNDVEFLNGKPTVTGDIYKVFKDKDNGLLFRIVNEEKKQWAFYNDTLQYQMEVEVTFEEGSKMRGMGLTKVKKNDDGSTTFVVTVNPTRTETFAQGDHTGFSLRCKSAVVSRPGDKNGSSAAAGARRPM